MKTLHLSSRRDIIELAFVRLNALTIHQRKLIQKEDNAYTSLSSHLLNSLVLISFIYLVFPVLIFICGYLRIEFAAILLTLITMVCYRLTNGFGSLANFRKHLEIIAVEWRQWRWHFAIMGVLCLIWLSFSSIGGIGYRNFDSGIRSSLLGHLVRDPWPLHFSKGYFGEAFGEIPDKAYVYYFAYYLPAAVVGKLLGWKAANLALFAYSWLGSLLALLLVRLYLRDLSYRATFLTFVGISLFGGMDYVFNRMFQMTSDSSDMWLSPFHYFSHTRNLYWAPQHCLPTWLMIGIVMNWRRLQPSLIRAFPIVIVSMVLWSPLCLLGIFSFLFPMIKRHWQTWPRLNVENPTATLLLFILIAFIASNDFSFKLLFAPNYIDSFWFKYIIFVVTEFLILVVIIFQYKYIHTESGILIKCVVLLMLIPFFMLGVWNDWSIKISMAPLFVLSVLSIQRMNATLVNAKQNMWIYGFIFGVSALTPLEELVYSVKHSRISFETPPEIRDFGPGYIVWQQLGDPDSFFFRHIALPQPDREASEQPGRPIKNAGENHRRLR